MHKVTATVSDSTAWTFPPIRTPQNRLTQLANTEGIDFSDLVNAMLRKDIELIEIAGAARQV